jgi:gas vesicle protein
MSEYTNNNSSHVGGIVAAFAVGALIGGGIALLYAPRSGKETRQLLAAKGRELKGKAQHAIEDVKGFAEGKKAEFSAAITAGKDAMQEERAKHLKSV